MADSRPDPPIKPTPRKATPTLQRLQRQLGDAFPALVLEDQPVAP